MIGPGCTVAQNPLVCTHREVRTRTCAQAGVLTSDGETPKGSVPWLFQAPAPLQPFMCDCSSARRDFAVMAEALKILQELLLSLIHI